MAIAFGSVVTYCSYAEVYKMMNFFNSSNAEIKKVTADHDDILIEGVLYIADGIEAIVINTQQLASYVRYTK